MAAFKVLSIAVASGRAGFVYLHNDNLLDWGVSVKAVKSTNNLVSYVQDLVNRFKPDVLVTEKCVGKCKKGKRTRHLIDAAAEIASHNPVLDVCVERPRRFQSKYEEADSFAARHHDLIGYLPKQKRRSFDVEPRRMIIFEALALAEEVLNGPPEALAAAMG
jgi:hypothetical protein